MVGSASFNSAQPSTTARRTPYQRHMYMRARMDSSDAHSSGCGLLAAVTSKDRFISPARQIKLANAIAGATIHPVHAGHAACVLSYRRFVPGLVDACDSVASRLDERRRDGRERLGPGREEA